MNSAGYLVTLEYQIRVWKRVERGEFIKD